MSIFGKDHYIKFLHNDVFMAKNAKAGRILIGLESRLGLQLLS